MTETMPTWTGLHADIVSNEWGAGFQRRVGRITIDWPGQPRSAEWFLKELAAKHNGSYLFVTEGHDPEACPFREGDILPMKATPVEGDNP